MALANTKNFVLIFTLLIVFYIVSDFNYSVCHDETDTSILIKNATTAAIGSFNISTKTTTTTTEPIIQLVPGELPGYTGWARPERTHAGYFHFIGEEGGGSSPPTVILSNTDWALKIQCQGHVDCSTIQPAFYLRAYGPAIITGQVIYPNDKDNYYTMIFHPIDVGMYTVEVIVMYSDATNPDAFPLPRIELPKLYEGYLLPNFPLTVNVIPNDQSVSLSSRSEGYCSIDQLSIDVGKSSSSDSTMLYNNKLWRQARWKVFDSVRYSQQHTIQTENNGNALTLLGYKKSYNSLGFLADYQFYNNCHLITAEDITTSSKTNNNDPQQLNTNYLLPCLANTDGKKLHIILIGDSVMRLQKDILEEQFLKMRDPSSPMSSNTRISFYELYGGILRCERLGKPNLLNVVEQLKQERILGKTPERRIVLYNSGMHDIHRLCDNEFINDRKDYMTQIEIQNRTCTQNYASAFEQLTATVQQMDADVIIFQTTTAAWPKYGNYGIAWDARYGQKQPLDSTFVYSFNQIALRVIQQINMQQKSSTKSFFKVNNNNNIIHVTDVYWMTLARPDNREIDKNSEIGKKLSHPGVEVINAIVRIWLTLAFQLLLPSCST